MKVFISWSGERSQKLAQILREWIPSVLQSVTPYVSSEDIDKGARWSSDIANELDESDYGILCVTKENLNAPWLNFEAGALGKAVQRSRVCPFLIGIKRSEVQGPLLQFQSTINEKDEVYKLLNSINEFCGDAALSDERLSSTFEVWWPKLESNLQHLSEANLEEKENVPLKEEQFGMVLEELLELSRNNQKIK